MKLTFDPLFSQSKLDFGYTRIRTPFTYPDGDVIDLFYQIHDDGNVTLSDRGETMRWLESNSYLFVFDPDNLIKPILDALGITIFCQSFQITTEIDKLESTVIQLIQGIIAALALNPRG